MPEEQHTHKWWILAAIGISLLMSSIDGTIVNVALPTLTRELQTEFATIQWVVLSYLLGLAVLMLSMGRLGDMVGKKQIFSSGLVLFVAGSVLCGLSPGVYWLIVFRFIQSIGAAMMLALGVAIVTETWPAPERGKAIGISGGIISLGIALGPALGGIILQYLDWRWIFFVNLPIGILALILVWVYVPPLKPKEGGERFDYLGALLVGVALLTFSLSMTFGQVNGFLSLSTVALLALSIITLGAFVWVERTTSYPMVDLSLLQNSDFSLNLLTGFLTFAAISAVVLLLPFYLELGMGLNQQQVGLAMAVVPLVLGILAPISGVLSDRYGTRPVSVIGLAILMTGYLALTTLNTSTQLLGFLLALLPVGIGMAIFQSPNNTAIMSAAPRARLGVASGMLSMTRVLGQSTGIALLGAFFAARLVYHSGEQVDINNSQAGHLVSALTDQFLMAALLVAVGLAIALRLGWREYKARKGEAVAEGS
ncbi:MAG: MFS transporter [Chloroflexi bacterium]|nr:MFS transporter [Chloroflexota bacterium]